MAILPKNPDQELFLESLDYCVERNLLTSEDKESAIQQEGISTEMWEKIKKGSEDLTERPLIFALILKKLDRQLIHPDHSNYNNNSRVFPVE